VKWRPPLAALLWTAAAGAQTGVITTVAGTGERGFSGDGGPATAARLGLANLQNECDSNRFEQAAHLFADRAGNVYFTDSSNHRVRRITPQGIIDTVAGSGERPSINNRCEPTSPIGDAGPARSARLYTPADVLVDGSGNLIIVDEQNNRLRQVNTAGQIASIVGSGLHAFYAPGVPATNSGLDWPVALALGSGGVLHFVEVHSNRVARVGADGRLATVAGDGFPGFSGDGGAATIARLNNPTGIAFDAAGNLYIADQANHRLRRVTPAGVMSTVAGTGQPGFSGDGGPAAGAQLNQPADVKADAAGNLYVADMANHRVRRISSVGTISTVAGTGQAGRGADGVAAASSALNFPSAVTVDAAGDVYLIDWQNYLIRKVSFSARGSISPGGVVNGASFAPAPIPVAPGSILSIFGVNLAPATALASEVPLPVELAGTSVRINGTPAPLFFVSPGQINAQLPFNVAAGQARAVVTNPAGESAAEAFNVAASAVGIFQLPGTNRAIALNQNGTINSPDNPESRGNVLVVFLTGQGTVSPAVPTGQAAPLTQLTRAALPASANIGRAAAEVVFLGLTPGFVGLAQANLQVPAGAQTGNEVVMFISVDGQAGNTATVSIR